MSLCHLPQKRILLLLLSTVLLLSILPRLRPAQRELWHADLLDQMEQTDDFSEFCDLLFRYGVTSDSVTTAYTLAEPSAYGIPYFFPSLTSREGGKHGAKKQAAITRNTSSLLLRKLEELNVPQEDTSASLTGDLLKNRLTLELALADYPYYEEPLGSTNSAFSNLPVIFGEYPLHREQDLETYLTLLAQVPDCFQAVMDYEKERRKQGISTPSFILQKSADSLSKLVSSLEQEENFFTATFEERLDALPDLDKKKRQHYIQTNRNCVRRSVLPAYRKLLSYVEDLLSAPALSPSASTPALPEDSSSSGCAKHMCAQAIRPRAQAEHPSTNLLSSASPADDKTDPAGPADPHDQNAIKQPQFSGSADQNATQSSQSSSSINRACMPEENISYGLSSLPDGKAYYALLVQKNTGSARSTSELIRLTGQRLKNTITEVTRISLTDPEAYRYYVEHPQPSGYEEPKTILEVLPLMIRKDFPQLNDPPSCQLKQVPESLSSFLSPAFFMIPQIDRCGENTIYINPLCTDSGDGSLFTTLAHEGYPGHLYQTAWFYATNPPLIRHLLDFPGYEEGWAAYAELYSLSCLHFPENEDALRTLYQSDLLINLALCARMDLGVNYEGWTLADARNMFEDYGFQSYYAAELYSYVVEAPAVYLRYYVGLEEILALKEDFRKMYRGENMELEFHKALLKTGPGDFETIRRACIPAALQPDTVTSTVFPIPSTMGITGQEVIYSPCPMASAPSSISCQIPQHLLPQRLLFLIWVLWTKV